MIEHLKRPTQWFWRRRLRFTVFAALLMAIFYLPIFPYRPECFFYTGGFIFGPGPFEGEISELHRRDVAALLAQDMDPEYFNNNFMVYDGTIYMPFSWFIGDELMENYINKNTKSLADPETITIFENMVPEKAHQLYRELKQMEAQNHRDADKKECEVLRAVMIKDVYLD